MPETGRKRGRASSSSSSSDSSSGSGSDSSDSSTSLSSTEKLIMGVERLQNRISHLETSRAAVKLQRNELSAELRLVRASPAAPGGLPRRPPTPDHRAPQAEETAEQDTAAAIRRVHRCARASPRSDGAAIRPRLVPARPLQVVRCHGYPSTAGSGAQEVVCCPPGGRQGRRPCLQILQDHPGSRDARNSPPAKE